MGVPRAQAGRWCPPKGTKSTPVMRDSSAMVLPSRTFPSTGNLPPGTTLMMSPRCTSSMGTCSSLQQKPLRLHSGSRVGACPPGTSPRSASGHSAGFTLSRGHHFIYCVQTESILSARGCPSPWGDGCEQDSQVPTLMKSIPCSKQTSKIVPRLKQVLCWQQGDWRAVFSGGGGGEKGTGFIWRWHFSWMTRGPNIQGEKTQGRGTSLVVQWRTPPSQCTGAGFDPRSGN